ncbi:hypothetical protein FOCC_FOCC016064 [Frankliniella occidentalis]|nr:hypothetical protein FOCC_FOCC016064 [Frankliniella occidentalis]
MKLLRSLVDAARVNVDRSKGGYRFQSTTLKQLFSYIYTEVLQKNLGAAIPFISTICRTVSKFSWKVSEGEFRFKQLKEYLLDKNYPLSEWISEDATRITGRIQYDPKSNQIVGFVPPFDDSGIPISNNFPATSADTITAYFEKATRAANVQLWHSLYTTKVPRPVCVVKRWRWMLKEAAKEGISILGFSSDGDPKLLKAMRFFTFSGEDDIPLKWAKFFSANWDLDLEPYCMQDAVHIGTKLRSLLLKRKRLPMGPKYAVSITHLEVLIAKEEKELHGLCATDITTADKMNF